MRSISIDPEFLEAAAMIITGFAVPAVAVCFDVVEGEVLDGVATPGVEAVQDDLVAFPVAAKVQRAITAVGQV